MKQSKTIIVQIVRMVCLLLLCVVIAPAFVSCGSHDEPDNDKAEKSIVGVWRHEFVHGYRLLTLERDGTYSEVEYNKDGSIDWSDYGTYEMNGNILKLSRYLHSGSGVELEVFSILTLTETKLIIRYEGEYVGQYDDEEYDVFFRVE